MQEIPYGYCHCGMCGEKTEPYKHSDPRSGAKKGEPRLYIRGHALRRKGPDYIEQDLGYETPCWIWQWGLMKNGYAKMSATTYGHIVYYERDNGPVPEGLHLDHLCHNADLTCPGGLDCIHRRCLNPLHLKPKPTGENTRAGRAPKLSAEDVREIRATPRTYGSTLALARKFGVHPAWLSAVRNGRGWTTE